MNGDEAVLAVIRALEALGIPYMVVGSLSTNIYGVSRATEDADLVIQLGQHSIYEIADRLGSHFHLNPQMSFETVTLTLRHIIELDGSAFKVELFHLSDDAHDQERFRRRQRVKTLYGEVSAPTAEDVIVTKVRWAALARRTKDGQDAHDVIAVQGDRIDWEYVNAWCDRHGSRALLDEIRRSIPPM